MVATVENLIMISFSIVPDIPHVSHSDSNR